jgi:uncharacterized protein (TIGR03435 family)
LPTIRHNLRSSGVIGGKGSFARPKLRRATPQEINKMKRFFAGVGLCVFASCAAFAQGNPPAFEVASIKQAAPQAPGRMMVRMGGDAGRVDYANVSLKDVLARAYNMKRFQVSGPSWLDNERYDITAKVPDGVKPEQVPAMLQVLLAERFKMVAHKETKEQPVYALVVGKGGPKLTKSEEANEGAAPKTIATPDGGRMAPPKGAMMMRMSDGPGGNARMQANGVTLARFSDMLSGMLDRPVLDMTELTGNYDIALDVSMEDLAGMKRMAVGPGGPGGPGGDHGPAPDAAPAASIFTAVQSLGLKLDPRKAPVEFLIVDRGEKVPTEN